MRAESWGFVRCVRARARPRAPREAVDRRAMRRSIRRLTSRPPIASLAGRLDVFALRGRGPRQAAALESRSQDRHRGAARVRQAARLSRRGARGRLQVPVGAQPPPAPRDARAGVLRSPATAAYARGAARAARELVRRVSAIRMGPNWSSSLEAGLRLINWSLAWQLLGGVDSALFAGEAGASLPRALARLRLPALPSSSPGTSRCIRRPTTT